MMVAIVIATALALASTGGGLYELLVVDPFWPKRPDLIQPTRGGVSRRRFWIPAHVTFEVALIASLVLAWPQREVRVVLLVAAGEPCRDAPLVGIRLHSQGTEVRADRSGERNGGRGAQWTRRSLWALAARPRDVWGDAHGVRHRSATGLTWRARASRLSSSASARRSGRSVRRAPW